VLLHDAAAKREAETGAAKVARVACVALLEAVEDAFQLVGRNASTLILDDEADFAKS
jgi:hypothetical protein